MNNVIISTVAALTGSAVGALAPILSNYVMQRAQTKRELLNHQIAGREGLYSDFIQEASHLHAHSRTHDLEDPEKLVALYALVARIRLLSSVVVVTAAEQIVHKILMHYGERNLTMQEMREEVISTHTDPLASFSTACRKELMEIFARGVINQR